MKWPPKRAGAPPDAPDSTKLTGLPESYHGPSFVQSGFIFCHSERIWRRWEREAARLFREFWRSGNQKHFHAFFRHVAAMRVYGGPRIVKAVREQLFK